MARYPEWTSFCCGVVFLLVVHCCRTVTSSTVQPTEGSVLQTSEAPFRSCYFYDSLDGRNRTCFLTNPAGACFTFIRKRTDGTFRWRRGCSANCEDDRRNRKIQVCCSTNLCNMHVLTPDNFSSSSDASPQTTPTFSTTHQMPSESASFTVAPSVTIIPPILIPETKPEGSSDVDSEDVVTQRLPTEFFTCNCNQCGQLSECVGAMCVASFAFTPDNQVTYNYFCSNSSVCPENLVCCNTDKCNAEVVVPTDEILTTAIGRVSQSSTTTKINAGTTTRGLDNSPRPAVDYSEKYFTIATAVSVVGGVLVMCVILVILACVILHFRRKTTSAKLLRQSSPSSINCRNGGIIKPSPSPSYSLNSTATNSDSSNAHSNSTMSDSCKLDDNPLKYLGTSV